MKLNWIGWKWSIEVKFAKRLGCLCILICADALCMMLNAVGDIFRR